LWKISTRIRLSSFSWFIEVSNSIISLLFFAGRAGKGTFSANDHRLFICALNYIPRKFSTYLMKFIRVERQEKEGDLVADVKEKKKH
jgi:hypothetical protein